jgi:hypothetical protein
MLARDRDRFAQDYPLFLTMLASSAPSREEADQYKHPRLPQLFERNMERVYQQLVDQHPELAMTEIEFKGKVRGWRRDGAYVSLGPDGEAGYTDTASAGFTSS